jgi:hypothetical protein
VSRFYLLPSRPVVGERFACYLKDIFPGLDWPSNAWAELAESLGTVAARRPDVFVVYREELPAGEDAATALTEAFGAEPGDEIVEVLTGSGGGELTTRRWRMGGAA